MRWPIAAVGMTEGEAKNSLGSVKVYQSDFRAMKNVVAGRNERSLFKMICEGDNERIVGIHMISPEAPEMMQAAAIAVKAGLTKKKAVNRTKNTTSRVSITPRVKP